MVSTNYCTNILKMITLAVISVIGGTNLQNDLEQFKENILFLSNYTLESRNFGYAVVHRDEAELEKPTLVRL